MENRKLAVLIDSENTPHSKLNFIIEELSSYGQIVVKRAYGDFSSDQLKNWKKPLNEIAIQPRQQFAYTTGKNSTDALMIIDAMDLLYSKRFDTFAIVSSDSDFTSLATRLKESEIQVIGVGKGTTPVSFKNACDDFIAIEVLEPKVEEVREKPAAKIQVSKDLEQEIWQLMHQAWQKYRNDNGWAELISAGKYLKRLKPDFDPRNYGLNKLSDFFDCFPGRYDTDSKNNSQLLFKLITKASVTNA
ncbi:NYN domain-containing protein [Thalassotalea mangrovi]|uniref:NYN domain-containing protein n=1 Tax=Thalassotalea mangrovi TaxID=2572245 RepID=A0A4U1B6Z2_9GAMM|nr:NYN domain-containing protein [Thalassotalea mangrovi]TKB46328.1 NYN domain-containing protein [Thalassotalea mangrovi]